MSGIPDGAAILGIADAYVALSSAGKGDYGQPATVHFKARDIESSREVVLMGLAQFCDALKTFHKTLKGRVQLEALEHDFLLAITSVGDLGHLKVDVTISEQWGGPVEFAFSFSFPTDQSYLPSFLSALSNNFISRAVQ